MEYEINPRGSNETLLRRMIQERSWSGILKTLKTLKTEGFEGFEGWDECRWCKIRVLSRLAVTTVSRQIWQAGRDAHAASRGKTGRSGLQLFGHSGKRSEAPAQLRDHAVSAALVAD
jgi:hypothetical protein